MMKVMRLMVIVVLSIMQMYTWGTNTCFTARSKKHLYTLLRCYDEALVLFYHNVQQSSDKARFERIEQMQNNIATVSKHQNIPCVMFNIAQNANALYAQNIGINRTPVLLIFRNGTPLRDQQGALIILQGLFTQGEVKRFIRGGYA